MPYRSRALCYALAAALLLTAPLRAAADAMVRSQAMFANTIAEYFVEEGRVRVELEIGLDDLETFRDLLPDELLAKLDN